MCLDEWPESLSLGNTLSLGVSTQGQYFRSYLQTNGNYTA